MSAIKSKPPVGVGARCVARHVRFSERKTAMNFNIQVVMALAVPGVIQWNTHIATAVAHAVVYNDPLNTEVFPFSENIIGPVDSN